jgi:hypothetical protein
MVCTNLMDSMKDKEISLLIFGGVVYVKVEHMPNSMKIVIKDQRMNWDHLKIGINKHHFNQDF